jgi:Putative amidoligase enzyme
MPRNAQPVDVNEMTFGIEIETTMPAAAVARVGGHGNGCQVEWLPQGWLADADPSIRADYPRRGVEFVSPVLKGKEGVRQVIDVIRMIVIKGGKVNASCGLHVHIGFNKRNPAKLRALVALVANFEKAIYASTGTTRRETGSWCHSFQGFGSLDAAMSRRGNTRYMICNTITDKPTVEFRAFAATLNTTKIVGHILTCVALVEKTLAAGRVAKFTAKTPKESSPIHRSGVGQTAVCRLFYALGWTKGREKRVFGDLLGDGTPTLKEIKREIMRLARKYDRGGATDEE